MESNYVSVKIRRETNQKMKVVASLEAQTISQWLAWVVDKAYEATMHNRGRKELVK